MNVNIRISRLEISRYVLKCVFLTTGSSDGKVLSQLYLELVDTYKKRYMPQNGQAAILKFSPIRKKIRKSFKTLSKLKAQVHSKKEAWKQEAMAVSAGKGTLLSLWNRVQIWQVSKLLLILILTHGTVI